MSVPTPTPPPPGLNSIVDQILNALPLNGLKTYIAAAGTFGLALYQAFGLHDYVNAWTSLMAALTLVGLRHAVAKSAT